MMANLIRQSDQVLWLSSQLSGNTVITAITDHQRNTVISILSVPQDFGSGISVDGVFLSNRGTAFSRVPGHPNAIAPGKRPLLTLAPIMAFQNERPAFCLGISGGDNQPLVLAQMISWMLDHGLNIQEAINAPRLVQFPGKQGAIHMLEKRIPAQTMSEMRDMGYRTAHWNEWDPRSGQAQGLAFQGNVIMGAADARAEGMAFGW